MSDRLANIHLAPEEDDDDLYGGFEQYDPTQDVEVGCCMTCAIHSKKLHGEDLVASQEKGANLSRWQ